MQSQNYSNHRRFIPLFHFATLGLAILVFFAAVFKLYKAIAHGQFYYNAIMLVLISLLLISLLFYCRVFALKAQDRAIRAEENFRHFILTGKPFDSRLRIGQIIALRFAPDEELPLLAAKAVNENMKSDAIKKAIKNWRPDDNRV